MSRFSRDTDSLKTYILFTCEADCASWMPKPWRQLFLYLTTLLTRLWTIIPAAQCPGEYLLVMVSSLFSGHCPANHFPCVNTPAAFRGAPLMMHKSIRTRCLNRSITSATIVIHFSCCFQTGFLCTALGSTELLTYFVLSELGDRQMKWLAQGHAGVHGRNEDTNNTPMFKLSPEEFAELCLLCEGGFERSDIGIKEISELYSRNQMF